MLRLVANWASEEAVLQSCTIAFHLFLGRHSGVNLASSLYSILVLIEISEKLEHITTDNATNNDQPLIELCILLGNQGITFDPES